MRGDDERPDATPTPNQGGDHDGGGGSQQDSGSQDAPPSLDRPTDIVTDVREGDYWDQKRR